MPTNAITPITAHTAVTTLEVRLANIRALLSSGGLLGNRTKRVQHTLRGGRGAYPSACFSPLFTEYEGGALPGEKNPAQLVAGRFRRPFRPRKPTQSYPLVVVVVVLVVVVVPIVVPLLAFVVVVVLALIVVDFGDDRGLSY